MHDPIETIRAPNPATWVRHHPVASFFVATYVLSWSAWIPIALAGRTVGVGSGATHVPGLLGPMIAAFLVTAATGGRAGVAELLARMTRWRVGAIGALLCLLSPFVFFAVAVAISGPPVWERFGHFNGLPVLGPLAVWALLVLVNGFGEETGWRGFALPALQRTHSPLVSTGVIALLWAGWHIPNFFFLETYRGFDAIAFAGFLVGLFFGAVVLTFLYNHTRQSVLMLALWHGSYNFVSATVAVRGTIAAIVSSLVMAWGIGLLLAEIVAQRRGRSVLGVPERGLGFRIRGDSRLPRSLAGRSQRR